MSSVSRHRTLRRLGAALVSVSVLPVIAFVSPPAQAATLFTVVGTSDVSDSQLMSAVITPDFQAAYPQYQLNYVPKGTGAAITYAEAGSAAALLVHAASVENQFVGQGYSLEPAGRAIFYGDYVLLGPASDPAGVLTNAPHDIVKAFEDIATAGGAGHAEFITRGAAPGTAIQERQIWAQTTGVPLCAVGNDATNNFGGGDRPTGDATKTTCANPDDTTAAPFPTWYHKGDSTSQAANISIANACTGFTSPNCYVFTDRGTFNYEQSIGVDTNLSIVTRDNSPSAIGGREDLINVFHAYGINPAKFTGTNSTDPVAAKLFLDFLQSPAEQAKIGAYLGAQQPFVPDAVPGLTGAVTGQSTSGGKPSTISGHLSQPTPGYPALANATVNLLQADSSSPLAIPTIVASGTTNATGDYTISHPLTPGKYYSVGVGAVTQTENATLNPVFKDTFAATSKALGTAGGATLTKAREINHTSHKFKVKGTVAPAATDGHGTLVLTGERKGKHGKAGHAKQLGTLTVVNGKTTFKFTTKLKPGKWKLQVSYQDGTVFLPVQSANLKVKVG